MLSDQRIKKNKRHYFFKNVEKYLPTHFIEDFSSISQNPAFDIQKTKGGHPKDQVVFCHLHRRIHFSIDQIG